MSTYKLAKSVKLSGEPDAVLLLRVGGDLFIPFDPSNTDYQEYLKWLAEGNEPLPADTQPA